VFDLNSDEVEEDLAENAVLEVELAAVELELNVEALFDAHLHLDRSVLVWLGARVGHYELFFLRYAVVIAVDHHVDVVPKTDYDPVVAFKLFLDPVELEVILDIVSKGPRRLKVSDDLKESRVLVLVVEVLDDSNEFDSDAQVVNAFVLVEGDGHLTFNVLSVLHKSITPLAR